MEIWYIGLGWLLTLVITGLILSILDSRRRLLEKFENGTWSERKHALRKVLSSIWNGDDDTATEQRIVQVFRKAFTDRDWHVRKEAVRNLQTPFIRRAIPDYRDYAIRALDDRSAGVRKEAARVLQTIRAGQSVDALLTALRDDVASVRKEAAIALGHLHDIRVVEPLLAALGDENVSVQKGAIAGLNKASSLVRVVVFGKYSETNTDWQQTVVNPDVSQLPIALRRLHTIIVETSSYNVLQLEQFLTYAVNCIGQRHLKKHVDVHVYGEPETGVIGLSDL